MDEQLQSAVAHDDRWEDKGYALLTNGYRPLEDVLEPLERWWAAGAPVTKTR